MSLPDEEEIEIADEDVRLADSGDPTRASCTPASVLQRLASELVSLLDLLIEGLVQSSHDLEALRPVSGLRAEIANELLQGVEIDRTALAAECLDLALLLASRRFMAGGELRMRAMLLATSLAGAA